MSNNGVYPCFICRQALVDFCNSDVKIVIYDINGNIKTTTVGEICTYAFGKGDLL